MKFLSVIGLSAALIGGWHLPSIAPHQADPTWEMMCIGKVDPIKKKLPKALDKGEITIKDKIIPCTKHVYEFTGSRGQQINAQLKTKGRTYLLLWPEHGDGVFYMKSTWHGELPTDGKYKLTVVTETTADYQIQLKLK